MVNQVKRVMKELSIEEKAKAYDIALDKIKRLLGTGSNCSREELEYVFPELKESEDEKVRKNIIATIHLYYGEPLDDEAKEMIAWLEKQKATTFNKDIEKIRNAAIYACKYMADNFENSTKQYEDAIAYLEKQGEQKPVDKVESKFKVGDKIRKKVPRSFDKDMEVARIEKDYYVCNHIGKFSSEVVPFSEESYYELIEHNPAWSEEDEPQKELAEIYLAVFDKKFPILPTLKGKQLAEYKNFLNKCQQILGLKYWGLRPLQAKLFEKLSLLWAAWGAEHLKGLGQTDGDTDNEKQKWSEEDESLRLRTIGALETCKICSPTKCVDEQINWLKSLRPQNHWKPSEEQMEAVRIAAEIGTANNSWAMDVLKSMYQDLKRLREE